MDKDLFILQIKHDLIKYYQKAKYSKIKLCKFYYIGKCYIHQELYRRLTGLDIDISLTYFNTRGNKEYPLWMKNY